jgi:pimeloyl-ACP methyl ester carboxylesterase/DNA-binding CsgD family transcriptional regulator
MVAAYRDPAGATLRTMPSTGTALTADGVRIAWRSVGDGPALIYMPGVPFSNMEGEWRIPTLRHAFEELGRDVRWIQYDGRGTGRSQRDVTDLSLDAFVRDLDAVVEAVGVHQVVLLGFYHSVTHAIAWAARHPERVRGLVLYGGALRGWDPMRGSGTQALLSLIERDWDTFVESIAHAWLGWPPGEEGRLAADWFRTATTPAIARATLQGAGDIDVTADAALVTCPALLLHRADATVIPFEVSAELARALPGGRLEVLPGSNASLFFEDADRVVARLVAFVRDPLGQQPAAAETGDGRAGPATHPATGPGTLSLRETEVLRLLADGESNGQIAARLGISINTVERHVSNLYRKIDARGRAEATAWAIRHDLA